jgi:hypothetical protein
MTDEIVIGGDAADVPEGIYPAKLDTIEVRPGVKYEGDFRIWTFTLDNGSSVSGTSSVATSSRSKSYEWIRALLGRKPEKGEKVTLAGLPCQVRVEHDDDGWPRVTDVLPTSQSAGGTAAVPPTVAVAATKEELPF